MRLYDAIRQEIALRLQCTRRTRVAQKGRVVRQATKIHSLGGTHDNIYPLAEAVSRSPGLPKRPDYNILQSSVSHCCCPNCWIACSTVAGVIYSWATIAFLPLQTTSTHKVWSTRLQWWRSGLSSSPPGNEVSVSPNPGTSFDRSIAVELDIDNFVSP